MAKRWPERYGIGELSPTARATRSEAGDWRVAGGLKFIDTAFMKPGRADENTE
jgi:hypothetical protein